MGHNLGHNGLVLDFDITCKTKSQGSKTRSRVYIINLRTAVNNAETAKATNLSCRQIVSRNYAAEK